MWRRKERGGEGGKSSATDSPVGSGRLAEEAGDLWRDEDPNWQQRRTAPLWTPAQPQDESELFLQDSSNILLETGEENAPMCFSLCAFLKGSKQTHQNSSSPSETLQIVS